MQSPNRTIEKEAIAVYYPQDPLERAIQDAFHKYDEGWLPMYSCKLALRAITALKMFDPYWFEGPIVRQRIEYLFTPNFADPKEEVIFLTHPLYLRDILENREINSYVYDPIAFVTQPIAHYLFREYPVHMKIDQARLASENQDITLLYIGGMILADQENVHLPAECITDIQVVKNKSLEREVPPELVFDIQKDVGVKVAATERDRGVFHIDEHERVILPSMTVWDKLRKVRGEIEYVEPGENGVIAINLIDGTSLTVGKQFFDHRFVIV